jgi:flagella basal body P-ring formation protein FlgA
MSLPAARQLAGAAALPATTAASSIAQGQILRRTDLCSPILVERGDIAMVRCVVGGLVISLKAEARADGARGQTIPFRKAREREDFLATVTGPAEAVVNLGPGGAQ